MKEKLYYFSPSLPPKSDAAAVRAASFIKTLESKFDIQPFCCSQCPQDGTRISSLASNKDGFIKRLFLEFWAGFLLGLKIVTTPFGTWILSSPPYFTVLIGSLVLRTINRPYYLDLRDLYPEVFYQKDLLKRNSFLGTILNLVTRKMINGSISSFTVSEGCRQHFVELGVAENKIIVVKNGFDDSVFFPIETKDDQFFKIAFHGNLGHFQEIEKLLEVIKKVDMKDRKVVFHVWGDGPKAHLLKKYNGDNLVFHGSVPYETAAREIANCHMGISFRTEDPIGKIALPVKIFEYLGVGVPVVVAPKSEIGEEINRHGLGFVCNYEKLQDCIDFILELKNDRERYFEVCQRVKERRGHYSRKTQAEILLGKLSENWNH